MAESCRFSRPGSHLFIERDAGNTSTRQSGNRWVFTTDCLSCRPHPSLGRWRVLGSAIAILSEWPGQQRVHSRSASLATFTVTSGSSAGQAALEHVEVLPHYCCIILRTTRPSWLRENLAYVQARLPAEPLSVHKSGASSGGDTPIQCLCQASQYPVAS